MSNDEHEPIRGPWNKEPTFDFRRGEPAVDGGSGMPEVTMTEEEMAIGEQLAERTASDPETDPITGAMLGMAEVTSQADVDDTGAQKAQKKVSSKS